MTEEGVRNWKFGLCKEVDFGIYFSPPTLLGLKKVQKFMEENGFPLSFLVIYQLVTTSSMSQNIDSLIEANGPNKKVWSEIALFSDMNETRRYFEFNPDWFGEKRTLGIGYGGDEEFFKFVDSNFDKIYKMSHSITINPFFVKSRRPLNIFKKINNVLFDIWLSI